MYDLTVIIPTYEEERNIAEVIKITQSVLTAHQINGEILIVDDQSHDGTKEIVSDLQKRNQNVTLMVRDRDHGLSQSVIDGFRNSDSPVLLVMDGDFSHPPELIPQMYREILSGADLVIGSRYLSAGSIKAWPWRRRLISKGATMLGRLLFPSISDPVSGFFAVQRNVVIDAPLKPRGYKILFEVLGKGKWQHEAQIPFTFVDRKAGKSKLSFRIMVDFVIQLIDLGYHACRYREGPVWKEEKTLIKFIMVGISGVFINMGVLFVLTDIFGIYYLISSLIAIELSILNNFIWNDIWTFAGDQAYNVKKRYLRLISYHIVSIGALLVNISVLFVLTEFAGFNYMVSNLMGILLAFTWNFLVNRGSTWNIRRRFTVRM